MKFLIILIGIIISPFDCSHEFPRIVIATSVGKIVIELYPEQAPITVANFYKYIDEKKFDNSTFYRTVTTSPDNQPFNNAKINVIQGGIDDTSKMFSAIIHETTDKTGIKHLEGTISMARDEPGTATSEFFICIGNQPALDYGGARHGDGTGFAAFGKVIEGMEVVNEIHKQPNTNQKINSPVKILMVRRID